LSCGIAKLVWPSKLRNDHTAKALAATDVDSETTRALRRAHKLVAKNAHGVIVFLLRKAVLGDTAAIFTQLTQ
jgi:hypothetical protein